MSSNECIITWNDHHRNVMGVFGRFLDESCLVDCTIAAEGQYLKAHRLLLSASSSYFELLFSQEMEKSPIVVLKGIDFDDLKSLIAFVYQGRVTVSEERLPNFVSAAKSLRIKGLPSDLSNISGRGTNVLSVVHEKERSLSHEPPKSVSTCSATDENSNVQIINPNTSRTQRNHSGNERLSSWMLTSLSEENALIHNHCVVTSDCQTKTGLFPPPSVKVKDEIEVEDTPIWESEDEHTSTVLSPTASAYAGEGNQNQLNRVPGPISCISASQSHISEKVLKSSSVSATSTDTANTSSFVLNVLTDRNNIKVKDSSSSMQGVLAEHNFCSGKESVAKSKCNALSAVLCSHTENLEELDNEVCHGVESGEKAEEIAERTTDDIQNLQNTDQNLDATANSHDNERPAWSALAFEAFVTSCMAVQSNEKGDNAKEVNVQWLEMEEHVVGECKSVHVCDSIVGNVVERVQNGAVDIDEDAMGKDHMVREQGVMVEAEENALVADTVVELNEAEIEDVAPLSSCISNVIGRKSYKCYECADDFPTVNFLKAHIKELHKKEQVNRCKVCMATFAFRCHLQRHMSKHTGERPFQCDECKMSFSQKHNLTRHLQCHRRDCPYRCSVCKVSFRQKYNLSRHMQKHNADCPYKCTVCKINFCGKYSLTRHLQRHTREHPHSCNVCKMSFSHKKNLTTHMQTHNGEHSYSCNVCKMSFNHKKNLTTHMQTHNGERSYSCSVCKMSFRQKNTLNRHMQRHNGERPYRCTVCKKSFSRNNTLDIHMRLHTGAPPFQCDVCNLSFNHKYVLTKHMEKHTKEHPYPCDVQLKSSSMIEAT